MRKWIQKVIVQKIISYLPYSHKINFFFQKHVTKGVYLTDNYFYDRLGHVKTHIDSFKKYAYKLVPESSLEIGTGWYPVVPVCLFLLGTDKIYSVDITFLTSKDRLYDTLKKFSEYYNQNKLKDFILVLPQRYKVLEKLLVDSENLSLEEILDKLNLNYLIEDARGLSLESNSIDLINSNNTFEHIYPDILIPILKEFKRVIRKDIGIMTHFIDMSDHFTHFDKSINIYNFLQFSDYKWKWIDNYIQPQSRLRIYDYEKIYLDLQIPITEKSHRKGDITQLESISLAKKYLNNPNSEIGKSHCQFVSKMSESSHK